MNCYCRASKDCIVNSNITNMGCLLNCILQHTVYTKGAVLQVSVADHWSADMALASLAIGR